MSLPTDLLEPMFETLAQRHEFSVAAVRDMHAAVAAGAGSWASFDHPEFGGAGQWMRGGLLMLSDTHDRSLHARVDGLCYDVGDLVLSQSPELAWTNAPGIRPAAAGDTERWWPAALGTPNATGQQNGLYYAYFAGPRRLALCDDAGVRLYDTGEHRIDGIAQQQGPTGGRLCLSSQLGTVSLDELPRVADAYNSCDTATAPGGAAQSERVVRALERLASLAERGHLSDEEFAAAKRALLARL